MAKQQVRGKLWTIPNLISLSRLVILLPLTIVLLLANQYVWGLVALVALGLTDWLDGFLARRLNQVSQFGKEMDPLADRISVWALVGTLIAMGLLPLVLVIIIFGVDLLVATLALFWFRGVPDVPVTKVGKLRTAVLLLALPAVIVGTATGITWIGQLGFWLMVAGTAGHVIAGIGYLLVMARQPHVKKTVKKTP